MPLKHFTETVLIVLLAAATIATGMAISLLPPLPEGMLSWATIFVLTLLYPLSLYGILRQGRADYWFRLLHFLPMLLAILWLVFEFLRMRFTGMSSASSVYTSGYGLLPVTLSVLAIALFCLHVIRRRVPRLSALGLLLGAFVIFSVGSRTSGWDTQLAALVRSIGTRTNSGTLAMNDKNLATSSNPEEEAWREKMRAVERSAQATFKSSSSALPRPASSSSAPLVSSLPPPKKLPTSGADALALLPMFLAGYCGVVHRRAKRRVATV